MHVNALTEIPVEPAMLRTYHGAGVCHCHCSGTPHCIWIRLHPASPAAALLSPRAYGSCSSEKYLREETDENDKHNNFLLISLRYWKGIYYNLI